MKILLLLPLLLGFSVPAIAHNEANGGVSLPEGHPPQPSQPNEPQPKEGEEGEEGEGKRNPRCTGLVGC